MIDLILKLALKYSYIVKLLRNAFDNSCGFIEKQLNFKVGEISLEFMRCTVGINVFTW